MGSSAEKIVAVQDWRTSDLFSESECAAFALAEEATETPAVVSEETYERARAYFDEAQLVAFVATVAMENYRARFNRVFEVESMALYAAD
ncbi:MAG: hypothetical protein CL569_07605 [Alphaproteobacteria bacterium]|nr:hypothetical protein [Alphaproteobacteria bacterium]